LSTGYVGLYSLYIPNTASYVLIPSLTINYEFAVAFWIKIMTFVDYDYYLSC
jgi:hypothetical protein